LHVCSQQSSYPRTERNQSALVKLGFANYQQLSLDLDILITQACHFANPQTETVEQRKNRSVGLPPHRCKGIICKASRHI
jgi:hypothetical protein